jgi:hypothetical protein
LRKTDDEDSGAAVERGGKIDGFAGKSGSVEIGNLLLGVG